MNNESENIIILQDEDGVDVEFEFLDLIEYAGEEYVILFPADEEEADEVVILKLKRLEEEDSLISVEDDEVLMAVYNIFKEKSKDKFNFID